MCGTIPSNSASTDRRVAASLARPAVSDAVRADAFDGRHRPMSHIVRALATFERSIVSAARRSDRYHFDRDDSAISESAGRGSALSQPGALLLSVSWRGCLLGHGRSPADAGEARPTIGPSSQHRACNLANALSYPPVDAGVYQVTHNPKDVGSSPPTLRNIAVTAPYARRHRGRSRNHRPLCAGGRTIASGPTRIGRDIPTRAGPWRPALTAEQKVDLVAFLSR